MLGNFVNASDVGGALRALARPRWAGARFHLRERDRVMATWGALRTTSSHWYDLPLVVEHRRQRAGGLKGRDHIERFVATQLGDRSSLRALSVGCGTGSKEVLWARTGRFACIDAFDLSEEVIAAASAEASAARVSDVTRFFVADLFEFSADEKYDVVLFEDALHHLAPMVDAVQKTEMLLRPGGYVVIHEYVGPNRLQTRRETVRAINGILSTLPKRYRERPNRRAKTKVKVPSRMRMILRDPSEAPESESILQLLDERFDLLDLAPTGGTLLYPLLDEIAQNFTSADGQEILSALLKLEDALIDAGDLDSNYVFATYRRR